MMAGWAGALLGVSVCGAVVHAAPMVTLDDEDFNFRWDFDAETQAGNYDLYNGTTGVATSDGTNEWATTPSPSGGVVTISNTSFSNTFWTNSTAAAAQMNTTTGYTIEYRVRATPATDLGASGYLSVDADDGTNLAAVSIQHEQNDDPTTDLALYWDLGPGGPVYATVAADEFFTIRFAATPDAEATGGLTYTLYINGTQVADGLSRERDLAGDARRMLLADVGGGERGTLEIDYVAFTGGAFAPVPEPGSLTLAVTSLALIAGRRHN